MYGDDMPSIYVQHGSATFSIPQVP